MFERKIVCLNCESIGPVKTRVAGSPALEIFLYLATFWLFFIPAIIYTVWRAGQAYQSCKVCGSRNVVPVESPKGREIMSRISKK